MSLPGPRRTILALAATVMVVFLFPGGSSVPALAADPPVVLTPASEDVQRTVPFGLKRTPKTVTLTFSVSPPLAQERKFDVLPVDLIGSNDVFPASQITTEKTLIGDGTAVSVKLTLDPTGLEAGAYRGNVALQGAGVTTSRPISLTATLGKHGTLGYILAGVVAFAGVLLGLFVKWLSETGAVLSRLSVRLEELQLALRGLNPDVLPTGFQSALARVRYLIQRQSAADADRALDELFEKQNAIVEVARLIGRMRGDIAAQRARIGKLPGPEAGKLLEVIDLEERFVQESADSAWPDPEAKRDDRNKYAKYIYDFSSFVIKYVEAPVQDRRGAPLKDALNLYRNRRFEDAARKQEEVVEPSPEPSLATFVAEEIPLAEEARRAIEISPAPAPVTASGWERIKGWPQRVTQAVIRRSGLAGALLFGAGTAIGGVIQLYVGNPSFEGAGDWLTLFAWGFGIQISGMTVAQAASSRLAPRRTG